MNEFTLQRDFKQLRTLAGFSPGEHAFKSLNYLALEQKHEKPIGFGSHFVLHCRMRWDQWIRSSGGSTRSHTRSARSPVIIVRSKVEERAPTPLWQLVQLPGWELRSGGKKEASCGAQAGGGIRRRNTWASVTVTRRGRLEEAINFGGIPQKNITARCRRPPPPGPAAELGRAPAGCRTPATQLSLEDLLHLCPSRRAARSLRPPRAPLPPPPPLAAPCSSQNSAPAARRPPSSPPPAWGTTAPTARAAGALQSRCDAARRTRLQPPAATG